MSNKKGRFGNKKKPKTPPKSNKRLTALSKLKSRENNPLEDVVDAIDDVETTQPAVVEGRVDRRGDNGLLLTDPHRARSDIKLVEMALRKGWNPRRKTAIRRRMEDIVMKTEAEVITKDGVVTLESAGDKLSIEASKVLVAMENTDLKRVELFDKMAKGDAATNPLPTTVIHVQDNSTTNNLNTVDDRRTSLLRLAERIGASEIVIDGETIRQEQLPRATVPLSKG